MTTEHYFTLPCYGGRRGERVFRTMLREEILSLEPGSHVWFKALGRDAREAKINGKVRTWKRDPERVEVPLKYGLYEYATFSLSEALERLLVEVPHRDAFQKVLD